MEGRHYVGAPHSLSLSPKTSLPAVSEPTPALNFDTAALRPSVPDCCDPKKTTPWAMGIWSPMEKLLGDMFKS